jgi:hypothetical protein
MPLPEPHLSALAEILVRIPLDAAWAITGSAGLALHGIEVPVRDIDIQTDHQDWQLIQAAFAEHVITPVSWSETEAIKSYFGAASVGGVTVEIVGAPQQRLPDGGWTAPGDPLAHRVLICMGAYKAPVLDLEWEERSYRLLGRTEKADLINSALGQVP